MAGASKMLVLTMRIPIHWIDVQEAACRESCDIAAFY
jgi:hypothetical protein